MRSLTFSIAVHVGLIAAVILFAPVGSGNGNSKGKGGAGPQQEIIAKPVKLVQDQPKVDPKKKGKARVKPKQVKVKDECPQYFGGIGVTFNSLEGVVVTAHQGYPAYRAGIREGDTVTSDTPITGIVGTPVNIMVISRGQLFELTLIREKICVSSNQEIKDGK